MVCQKSRPRIAEDEPLKKEIEDDSPYMDYFSRSLPNHDIGHVARPLKPVARGSAIEPWFNHPIENVGMQTVLKPV